MCVPKVAGSGPSPPALLLLTGALPLPKGCFLLRPLCTEPTAIPRPTCKGRGQSISSPAATSAARCRGFPGLQAAGGDPGPRPAQRRPNHSWWQPGGLSPCSSPAQAARPSEADPAAAALLEMSSVPLGRAANLWRAEPIRCLPSRMGFMREARSGCARGRRMGRGPPVSPRRIRGAQGGRGAGKGLLQGVTGFSGMREGERAKPSAASRDPGALAGCRLCPPRAPLPPCHPGAGGGTSLCPNALRPGAGTAAAPVPPPKRAARRLVVKVKLS